MSIRYRVGTPGPVAEQLRILARRSRAIGRYHDFHRSMKIIDYRLTCEARDDWSEPFMDIPELRVQMRFGADLNLAVIYAVHWELNEVFVKRFFWVGPDAPPDET